VNPKNGKLLISLTAVYSRVSSLLNINAVFYHSRTLGLPNFVRSPVPHPLPACMSLLKYRLMTCLIQENKYKRLQ